MTKILVSTDIGSDIDDALALLVMFNLGMEIEAVYTTNGDVVSRALIAKHMAEIANSKARICLGEAESYDKSVKPYNLYSELLVDESHIDWKATESSPEIIYKPLKRIGIVENGVEDMAKLLSEEKFIIFSLAPLTSIARVISSYPGVIHNIKHLYIMGCRFFGETKMEHNMHFDPQAARIVFDSEIPITVVPGDVCSRYRMPVTIFDRCKSEVGMYVKKMAEAFIAASTAKEFWSFLNSEYKIKKIIDLDGISSHLMAKVNQGEKERSLRRVFSAEGVLLDIEGAVFDSEYYMRVYNTLIEYLVNSESSGIKKVISGHLLSLIPESISVADVYIPYCFKYREKIKIIRGTVNLSESLGESYLSAGEKHLIVSDIDAAHFGMFLKENIY